jgi:hypothetical protein
MSTNKSETFELAETYNPNRLLDFIITRFQLKNDAALSRLLEVAPPVISKIRHHRLPVGASLLIRMNDVTGIETRQLRNIMGDRRKKYRISDSCGRPKREDHAAAKEVAEKLAA